MKSYLNFQHQSGLDYLYYADGEAWVVGATFGGPRVGIVNFERKRCPYQVSISPTNIKSRPVTKS